MNLAAFFGVLLVVAVNAGVNDFLALGTKPAAAVCPAAKSNAAGAIAPTTFCSAVVGTAGTGCCGAAADLANIGVADLNNVMAAFDRHCSDAKCKNHFIQFRCKNACRNQDAPFCLDPYTALLAACHTACPALRTVGLLPATTAAFGANLAACTPEAAATWNAKVDSAIPVVVFAGPQGGPITLSEVATNLQFTLNVISDLVPSATLTLTVPKQVTSTGMSIEQQDISVFQFPTAGWTRDANNGWNQVLQIPVNRWSFPQIQTRTPTAQDEAVVKQQKTLAQLIAEADVASTLVVTAVVEVSNTATVNINPTPAVQFSVINRLPTDAELPNGPGEVALAPCAAAEASKRRSFLLNGAVVTSLNCLCSFGCIIAPTNKVNPSALTLRGITQTAMTVSFEGASPSVLLTVSLSTAAAVGASYTVLAAGAPLDPYPTKLSLSNTVFYFGEKAFLTLTAQPFTLEGADATSRVIILATAVTPNQASFRLAAGNNVVLRSNTAAEGSFSLNGGNLVIRQNGKLSLNKATSKLLLEGGQLFVVSDGSVQSATLEVNGGEVVGTGNAAITLNGGLINPRASALRTGLTLAQNTQAGANVAARRYAVTAGAQLSVCNSFLGPPVAGAVTVGGGSQLLVYTMCQYTLADATAYTLTNSATAPNLRINMTGTTSLGTSVVVNDAGYLSFDQVNRDSKFLNIEGPLTFSSVNARIEVLIATGVTFLTTGEDVQLARFVTATGTCPEPPSVAAATIENCPTKCRVKYAAEGTVAAPTRCRVLLEVGPLTATPSEFRSATTWVNLNRDCATYGAAQFVYTATRLQGWQTNEIVVTDIACGSMTVFFKCLSTVSLADANSRCAALKAAIEKPASSLYRELGVTRPVFENDDNNSNNAVFALFTLVSLPLFCVLGFVFWYKSKQHEADNQYLQDTATFANVAAQSAPVYAYDPSKQYELQQPQYGY